MGIAGRDMATDRLPATLMSNAREQHDGEISSSPPATPVTAAQQRQPKLRTTQTDSAQQPDHSAGDGVTVAHMVHGPTTTLSSLPGSRLLQLTIDGTEFCWTLSRQAMPTRSPATSTSSRAGLQDRSSST